jgi:hypothetical protein
MKLTLWPNKAMHRSASRPVIFVVEPTLRVDSTAPWTVLR